MQSLKRILIVAVTFMLLLLVIGFLLPSAWRAEQSVVIRAPASTVFPYLNSLKQWREWTVWHQQIPQRQTEYSGPDAGVGATGRWSGENGRGVMKIMQSEHNRLVAYTLFFNGGEFRADGNLALIPEGDGTRVIWNATGEVGRSPIDRYFALILSRRVGGDFEESLTRLKQKLETKS